MEVLDQYVGERLICIVAVSDPVQQRGEVWSDRVGKLRVGQLALSGGEPPGQTLVCFACCTHVRDTGSFSIAMLLGNSLSGSAPPIPLRSEPATYPPTLTA